MTYPGGKNGSGVYQKIISLMPKHKVYIEAFLGGGAILRKKKPAEKNIGIEIDKEVIKEFWKGEASDVEILNLDSLIYLKELKGHRKSKDTLVYCDPPYYMSSRKSKRKIYRYEWNNLAHHEFLYHAKNLTCNVMISGYDSDYYNHYLRDWRKFSFNTTNRAGQKTTEIVWMNFDEPRELHDYSFIGANYREREEFKQKKQRWKNKLLNLNEHQRFALLAALDEVKFLDDRETAEMPSHDQDRNGKSAVASGRIAPSDLTADLPSLQ